MRNWFVILTNVSTLENRYYGSKTYSVSDSEYLNRKVIANVFIPLGRFRFFYSTETFVSDRKCERHLLIDNKAMYKIQQFYVFIFINILIKGMSEFFLSLSQ